MSPPPDHPLPPGAPSPAPPRPPRRRRRVTARRQHLGAGALTALSVVLLWLTGALDFAERITLDWRAQFFGFFSPGPSPHIAMVVVDDAALEATIGRWPWDRAVLADLVDELRRAQAAVIALDITLSDPQPPRAMLGPDGAPTGAVIQDDQLLAAAVARHSRVIMGTNFTAASASDLSRASGDPMGSILGLQSFIAMTPGVVSPPDPVLPAPVKARFLPQRVQDLTDSPEQAILLRNFQAAASLIEHAPRSSLPVPPEPAFWTRSVEPLPPTRPVAHAAARLASVTANTIDPDGRVRRVPIWVEHNGRLWPSLGAAGALSWIQSQHGQPAPPGPPASVQPRRAVVHRPDGSPTVLPLLRATTRDGSGAAVSDGLLYVAWPRSLWALRRGPRGASVPGWQWQFYDRALGQPAEVPAGRLYESARITRATRDNADALAGAYAASFLDPARTLIDAPAPAWLTALRTLRTAEPDEPAFAAALDAAQAALPAETAKAMATIDSTLAAFLDDTSTEQDRAQVQALRDTVTGFQARATLALRELRQGAQNVSSERARLRALLAGKLVFVGWVATGAAADFVASSIHPKTPGVFVHAAVASSILTGHFKRPGPAWLDLAATLALAALGTAVGAAAPILIVPALLGLLGAAWALLVGLLLWDYAGVITAMVPPALALLACPATVIIQRLLSEQRQRRRTEERFKSYVSPQVVDILVADPTLSSMTPQRRELTIMFTDLAGFTSLAERLGSQQTAELLATYLGAMTDIVQSHRATLDKYIGDCVMAFWGAPIDNPRHAADACLAARDMILALDRLNASGAFAAAGGLRMRVGIATGEVMVGDFGNPPTNSSYTVIGDTVNLASRLEGANKHLGSTILCDARTRALVPDPGLRWRRIGRLRVKGKAEFIELHELLVTPPHDPATGSAYTDACHAALDAFQAADLHACRRALDALDAQHGPSPWTQLYRAACDQWTHAGLDPAAPSRNGRTFDGAITLDEK